MTNNNGRPLKKVVLDTSVIINYANVDKLHLLLTIIDKLIFVPAVNSEVIRDHQRIALESMLMDPRCAVVDDNALSPAAIILASTMGLGKGECFAYCYADRNDCWLATDDRRAIRLFAQCGANVSIITSVDLLRLLLQEGVVDDSEGETIVADWSSLYRFHVDWPL